MIQTLFGYTDYAEVHGKIFYKSVLFVFPVKPVYKRKR